MCLYYVSSLDLRTCGLLLETFIHREVTSFILYGNILQPLPSLLWREESVTQALLTESKTSCD